jgi:ribosomal protein L11 methyltransferase
MVELLLRAPESLVDALSDALLEEAQALSVSVEDADAGGSSEKPLFGEPGLPAPRLGWDRSTLKVLFESEALATAAATLLQAQDWTQEVHLISMTDVADEDWVRLTQSQFAPVPITPSFWIVPSWHQPPPEALRVIRLDPGLAFGTGTHPTTRMCLRWIAQQAPSLASSWDRVLDYGCGSGILGIAAGVHGARGIDAVDIDPAAVEATQLNAASNQVRLRVALPHVAEGSYPLVLANILATPLKLLAPLLSAHVSSGGHLVLAGILERQVDELRAAYSPGLSLAVSDEDEGWVLMTAHRA